MDIVTTHHRAYRLPGHPAPPWQQDYMGGANTSLPWVDALEFACEWAALSSDAYYTRRAIVREVWNLGGAGLLRYTTSIPEGERFWGLAAFHLTQFLDHIRHGAGVRGVDCHDCSAVVSIFSNLLGVRLDDFAFSLLPDVGAIVLLIGHEQPSVISWTEHAVARAGSEVWDACLQVSSRAPSSSALPFGEPFVPQPVYGVHFTRYTHLITVGDVPGWRFGPVYYAPPALV